MPLQATEDHIRPKEKPPTYRIKPREAREEAMLESMQSVKEIKYVVFVGAFRFVVNEKAMMESSGKDHLVSVFGCFLRFLTGSMAVTRKGALYYCFCMMESIAIHETTLLLDFPFL